MCNLNCQDCIEGGVETAILPNNIGWLEQIYFISVMKKFCIWEETKGKDIWFVFYFVKNLIQISGTVSQDFVGPFS